VAVVHQAASVQQAQRSQVHKAKTVARNRQLPQVAVADIRRLAQTVPAQQAVQVAQGYNFPHSQVQQLLLGLVAAAEAQGQLHKAQVVTQQVELQPLQVETPQQIAVQVVAVHQ
jgi:hypothetical protein